MHAHVLYCKAVLHYLGGMQWAFQFDHYSARQCAYDRGNAGTRLLCLKHL